MYQKVELTFPDTVRDYCHKVYNYTDEDMERRFIKRAEQAVNELAGYLCIDPVVRYMDIGCGLGATTAALAQVMDVHEVHVVEGFTDTAQIAAYNKEQLQFGHDVRPWNDVDIPVQMVQHNLPGVKVVGHRAVNSAGLGFSNMVDDAEWPRFDVITSFRSWCHHYPVNTYIEFVRRVLPVGGLLAVDIRTDTAGEVVLTENGFVEIAWVGRDNASPRKTRRTIWQRTKR